MVSCQDVNFLQSIKPQGTIGKLDLLAWFDGNYLSLGTCLYAMFKLEKALILKEDGSRELKAVVLVGASAQVMPSKTTDEEISKSTPHNELC